MPAPQSTPHRIGRGGAGNTIRTSKPTLIPLPPNTILPSRPSISSTSTSKPRPQHTGRGGAGNTTSTLPRIPSQARLFSFDEELAHQLLRSKHPAPIYHVGRGGWANTNMNSNQVREGGGGVVIDGSRRRQSSETEGSVGSGTSEGGSEKSGGSAPRAILRKIGRKIVG